MFTFVHIGVCVCWEDEGEAAEEEDNVEAVGWVAELEAAEAEAPAEPTAAAAAADDELSVKLLWVMKRSRNFMAGRSVMMIFSTLVKFRFRFRLGKLSIFDADQSRPVTPTNDTIMIEK